MKGDAPFMIREVLTDVKSPHSYFIYSQHYEEIPYHILTKPFVLRRKLLVMLMMIFVKCKNVISGL